MKSKAKTPEDFADLYDREGILPQLEEEPVEFALDEELRRQIRKGARRRRLKNVSIKLDAAQIVALRKIATRKAMPYQTLIRSWLAEGIRRELLDHL
jgi:predicted DNA binding CopG/RHH family protein